VNKKTRIKLFVSLSISILLAGLIFLSLRSKFYQILELKALDLRFALKENPPSRSPILHIDIDDQSLSGVGRWPWPRNYHAKLTDILKECQARQILMDIIFTEEFKDNPQEDALFADSMARAGITYLPFYFIENQSVVSPELKSLLLQDITLSAADAAKKLNILLEPLQETLPQAKKSVLDEITRKLIRKEPDILFEGLLKRMEEEYGWYLFSEDENYLKQRFPTQKLLSSFIAKFGIDLPVKEWPFQQECRMLNVPIMAYTRSIKGSGFINAEADLDGVTRKIPLFVKYEDKILPQLTIAALMDFLGVKELETGHDRVILKHASLNGAVKDIIIPVDKKGSMLVNWQGRWGVSFKHVPYYLILRLQEVREQMHAQPPGESLEYFKKSEAELLAKLTTMVKGKICIVGLTATGTHDLRPIPLQENYPMAGIHSNLIDTILTGKFIVRVEGGLRLLIFLITALVIGFSSLMKLWQSLLLSLGYAIGYFLLSYFIFARFGLWTDLVGPLGIVVFGFSAITSFRFFTEEKEKLWIKQAFSHYLSNEVISELIEDPSRLKLGGERRLITVFFTDIRGFTAFSESHQPEEVVAMLNEILTQQVKVVFKYNGTLDKFVGDEVMAFFGAPGNRHLNDHAIVAVRTAVEIQAKMRQLKDTWTHEKTAVLQIGIGINTGEMVVGNMGSAERMDYTVIGDNVNLAARLCAAAEKDEIIISDATYALVREQILAEKMEPITVKGKSKPIPIYRVTGLK
jgi:adenylate cyclase